MKRALLWRPFKW